MEISLLSPTVIGLGLFAILTSAISTFAGMGGGVLLFAVMATIFPLTMVVPVHGIVQFISNTHRAFMLKDYIKCSIVKPYMPGAILGAAIAMALLKNALNPKYAIFLLVLLIAYTLFKPKKLNLPLPKTKGFFWLGLATGLLGMLVGAVDPILSPFFLRHDMSKEEIIANKTALQVIVHALKIPVFLGLGFDYIEFSGLMGILIVASLFGNKAGYHLLKFITQRVFQMIFKVALFLVGVRMTTMLF